MDSNADGLSMSRCLELVLRNESYSEQKLQWQVLKVAFFSVPPKWKKILSWIRFCPRIQLIMTIIWIVHRKEQIQNNVLKKVLTEEHPFTVKKTWNIAKSGLKLTVEPEVWEQPIDWENTFSLWRSSFFFYNHWPKIWKKDTKWLDEKDE